MTGDNFLSQLPDDPTTVVHLLLHKFHERAQKIKKSTEPVSERYAEGNLDPLIELMIATKAFAERIDGISLKKPKLGPDGHKNFDLMAAFFDEVEKTMEPHFKAQAEKIAVERIERIEMETLRRLGQGFFYEFDKADVAKLEKLTHNLRNTVGGSNLFPADYKHRLQMQLKKAESEVDYRVSDLDAFWGLVAEAGVITSKFGKEAQPVAAGIRQIIDLVWKAQAKAEGLPLGAPFPNLLNGTGTKKA